MRVLFISNLYPPNYIGGYEIACSEVVRGLIQRGHEALVLTTFSHVPALPDPEYIDRCLDLRWHCPYPVSVSLNDYHAFEAGCSNLQNTYEVATALRRFNPDVVYCWNLLGVGGLAILDLLTMLEVPWVLNARLPRSRFAQRFRPTLASKVLLRTSNDTSIYLKRHRAADGCSAAKSIFRGSWRVERHRRAIARRAAHPPAPVVRCPENSRHVRLLLREILKCRER
jgi:Glycosyltransferase Family 4